MNRKDRILVVDDDSMNLARTRIILSKEYDVILAESGAEALKLLGIQEVDLVLLDIDMPEMNGMETFRNMKKAGIKAINLGAVNYLKKPFRPQELLKRVSRELDEE